MRLDLALPIEIRPLAEGDLDGLEWDSEQAIGADYVRRTVAERGDEVIFFLTLANGHAVGRLGYCQHGVERGSNGELIVLLRRPIAEIRER
jgi:hypothetical protein